MDFNEKCKTIELKGKQVNNWAPAFVMRHLNNRYF